MSSNKLNYTQYEYKINAVVNIGKTNMVKIKLQTNLFSYYTFKYATDGFIQFYAPFKIISAHMRRANQYVGREPREKPLAHPQAKLGLRAVPVAERLRALCLNHSITSPLYLV